MISKDLTSWEFWIGTTVFSLFAYLVGSINTGQIVSKIWKKDLGKSSTGNYGSTNAGRVYGKKGFLIVFIVDTFKGLMVGIILGAIAQWGDNPTNIFSEASISFALIFVVVGHMWPIYFKFKGGKGVATSLGIFLTINWVLALFALAIFLVSLIFVVRISLASTVSAFAMTILAFFHPTFYPDNAHLFFSFSQDLASMIAMWIISFLVVIKHIPNYKRVISGEDKGIKKIKKIRFKIFFPKKDLPKDLL